jgi:hypothetical protein
MNLTQKSSASLCWDQRNEQHPAAQTPNLNQWFVCPVKRAPGNTSESFLDRTQGFLVRSDIAEIALSIAKMAEPNHEFLCETIPYTQYTPGLSQDGMVSDLRRWIGFMNHPDAMPLGTVVQMD